MPEELLHTQWQNGGTSENRLQKFREMFPAGQGFVEITPAGEIVLSQPSGGGTGSSSAETFFTEEVTVATLNQLPPCTRSPKYASKDFQIFTGWGDVFQVESGAFSVNPATRMLTITSGAEFDFQAGWKLLYRYAIDPNVGIVMLPFPDVASGRVASAFSGALPNSVTYIVRASFDQFTSAWKVFDDPTTTANASYWFGGVWSAGTEQWIEIEFSETITVRNVDVFPMQSGVQPVDFRFLVSNTHDPSSATYTEVFTRSGETWANTPNEVKSFAVTTPTAGKIFRFSVTQTVSSGNAPIIYAITLKP